MDKKRERLISVVIPTYGRPQFLARAIDSVLRQTFAEFEIIVVDDNNPDTPERHETEAVMRQYNDERIKYIQHEHNRNGSAARNTGIRHSVGEYVAFLDDDDEYTSDRLATLADFMDRQDAKCGGCYSDYVKLGNGHTIRYKYRESDNQFLDALSRNFVMGSGSNIFVRRTTLEELGGFDESFKRNQDIEFLVRLTQKYYFAYCDKMCLKIYTHEWAGYKIDEITAHYRESFSETFRALAPDDYHRVSQMLNLQVFRYYVFTKQIKKASSMLLQNEVPLTKSISFLLGTLYRKMAHINKSFQI